MTDSIQVRGEGGVVFTLDLPLHEAIADQLEKGVLVRVDENGDVLSEAPVEAPLVADTPAPEAVQAPEAPVEAPVAVEPSPVVSEDAPVQPEAPAAYPSQTY